MKTVTALYDTYRQAEDAVSAVKDWGIGSEDISIISRDPAYVDAKQESGAAEGVGIGSGLGLLAGGSAGLLTGLGIMAIPGVGPVVAAGWLVSTLAGAAAGTVLGGATGGLIGAMTGSDISENDAHVYAESVRRGGTLVTVRAHEDRVAEVTAILDRFHPIDVEDRRRTLTDTGWSRFEDDVLDTPIASRPLTPEEEVAQQERFRRAAGRQ